MALVIKNADIVNADTRFTADILCDGETIARIDREITPPPGAEVIDATGKHVFPGFIDPHTHIYLPFMGTYSKDNYETGTKAALVGGTTTIFEMVCPSRDMSPTEGFATWQAQAEGRACCDYTFHMGVTRFDADSAKQLREIVKQGVGSFKVFLAYKGAFGVDDTELWETLKLAKELGVIVTAHCENETLVAQLQKELLAAGRTIDPRAGLWVSAGLAAAGYAWQPATATLDYDATAADASVPMTLAKAGDVGASVADGG
jgi:dihydropyrimidinase